MIKIERTNSSNPDFINLVKLLDADIALRDGEDFSFYAQFNKLDHIKNVVVVYVDDKAIACGALKHYEDFTVEIKRMFTDPSIRGKGMATLILSELEKWAVELSYKKCILETGRKYPEAIALYQKYGFNRIPNYGPYEHVSDSKCFEKLI
jgi:putative acetyltransferase